MNESQLNSISNKSEEPWLKVVSATSLLPDSSDSCLQKGLLREDPDERRKRLENKQLQQSLESDLSQGSNSVESNSTFFVHSQLSKQTISAGSTYSEWKKEEITALIALYQSEKCLYDQTHQFFLDEDEKNKAYQRIQNLLANIRPNCSIIQIKDQIRSLLTQYIAEKLIKDSAIVAGHVTEHSYEPLMWCFGLFQFLDDHIVKTVIPGVKEEIIEMEEDCRSSTSNFICDKRIKDEKEDPYTFEGNSFTNDKSNSLHYAHDKGSTHIVTDSNRKRVSRMLSVKNIPAFDTDERDDIFGEYIASEMRIIKHNASLYLKTKQAIIDVLTSASFEFLNSE